MACSSCKTGKNGMPEGCGDKGHCATGGCNKLNTFDWLTALDVDDPTSAIFAEISFKSGARKTFYKINDRHRYTTGDLVIVDAGNGGYDIGRVSMMGDLVKLQMRKKNFSEDRITNDVLRKANQRDIEKMMEARSMEQPALVKARVIARTLGLDMKIGDVEYQADLKKATFYYTADGWIDFRELVKQYAKEFRIKIEMRQIGARQESARIGGIGSCGRELCCSTWLTDFKSVNTTAARYQNIAINQSKLSGQCGRLKCCLNYELDLYVDELEKYPSDVEVLKSKSGVANLVKIDIFKGLLYYAYEPERGRTLIITLNPQDVRKIKSLNDKNEYPETIVASEETSPVIKEIANEYVDVTGAIELPTEKRKKKKKKNRSKSNDGKIPGNQGQENRRPMDQRENKSTNKTDPNSTNQTQTNKQNNPQSNSNQQNKQGNNSSGQPGNTNNPNRHFKNKNQKKNFGDRPGNQQNNKSNQNNNNNNTNNNNPPQQ